MRSWVAFLLIVTLLGAPLVPVIPVYGQTKSENAKIPIVVVNLSIPEAEVERQGYFLKTISSALGAHPRVQMVSPTDVDRWVKRNKKEEKPPPASEQLRDARKALAKGKKAYESLNLKEAEQYLVEARREYILKLPALRSNRDLIDAHLYLGMTYVVLKKAEKAGEEFKRVVALDPTRELTSRDYSPQVIEAFEKAKQSVLANDPIRVNIDSSPPKAKVYLNGRFIGNTPVQHKLSPGEYFILLSKEGMKDWYEPVNLKKRLETVRVRMKPAASDLAWGHVFRTREGVDQQSGDVGYIEDLSASVHADFVFLASLTKPKHYRLLGQLYDSRTGEFSQVAVAAMGRDLKEFPAATEDLVATLIGFIRPDGYLSSTKSPDLATQQTTPLTVGGADRPVQTLGASPVPEKKWYKRWWIYPILAGIGVGAFFGATQIGDSGGSNIVIDNKGNF